MNRQKAGSHASESTEEDPRAALSGSLITVLNIRADNEGRQAQAPILEPSQAPILFMA
jgi:hypothetical protein